MLRPPRFTVGRDYGQTLTNVEFWRPYAEKALHESGFDADGLSCGFVGTYPTLLAGPVVVKLFGHFGSWRRSYTAELAANRAIESNKAIPAPAVLATGRLFPDSAEDWPYLVTTRLPGVAWRDARLSNDQRREVAVAVGQVLAALHAQPLGQVAQTVHPDWLATMGATAIDRQRTWGSLPPHLIDQIADYLAGYRADARCLVHADVTEDHLFVEDRALLGIIDWGDAMVTDPYYELGALHLGAFGADVSLLTAFLHGYGWPAERSFAEHAMQVALMHQFDLFGDVCRQVDAADTLENLADALWQPSR